MTNTKTKEEGKDIEVGNRLFAFALLYKKVTMDGSKYIEDCKLILETVEANNIDEALGIVIHKTHSTCPNHSLSMHVGREINNTLSPDQTK